MAFVPYHNIDGSTGVTNTLIERGSKSGALKTILITNTHATNSATVTLFLQSSPTAGEPETFNILFTTPIPVAMSLLLEEKDGIVFNNSVYGLYMTVGGADTLDVIITRTAN
tara:strand:- start:130 stop:465 length:336 start_codon:yes stop_codon:yes gene_type:complete